MFAAWVASELPSLTPIGTVRNDASNERITMSILFVIIAVVAIVLAITGGLVHAVNFLLWVGIVLLILAVIAFLIRSLSGRNRV